ncbi:electron transfer flavoprotein subunit alpha/FixB family protein [Clostridium cellulovorans]|uniref:Electron transfer flavoprotein alpha/beta-subunit n=1 Tax=Clostridium cellulovorans (strain ATCC 35296 / DSM 3052 / OCM 3 / 743B) TaxID=573061 RepID=D9ST03_CLOC7|nr:electron transfer flavoprotein subunit alpha/FixB family protein [Clostridium cellulovorans]ADL52665.1 Electron transfer flavoprotein alpha/beta-subunit [Clostridium cellulovorans 743B]
MNIADYKGGVWVFAEQRNGELQKVSLELLGKGKDIAEKLNTKLVAVLLGSNLGNLAKDLVAQGADEVLAVDSELLANFTTDGYTKVICDLVNENKPEVLFIGATFVGRDLGPRIAARLGTGLTADCTALDIDAENGNLLATRPAFGGNLMATIVCADHRPQMATVRPGVFGKLSYDEARAGEIKNIDSAIISASDIRTKVLEVVKNEKEAVDIGESKILVAGGRGIGTSEGVALLKELAAVLGGELAASRAAIEKGWIDKDVQVGQTGKTVRPSVYIAVGISGAIQHTAGMQDAEYIIAINKDADAPIMKMADLALVGDYSKIIPELINEIKAAKEQA